MPKIIKDGITYGAAPSSEVWEGTQAQYDALTTKDPDVTYFITDSDPAPATNAAVISYDNTNSGLYAVNVQQAIDEVNSNKANKTWTYVDKINLNGTCNVDGYSEVLIVLYVNNNRNRESHIYPISELSSDTEMHSIIVNSSTNVTNYATATVKVASNTLTYTARTLIGWTSLYLKVYAR